MAQENELQVFGGPHDGKKVRVGLVPLERITLAHQHGGSLGEGLEPHLLKDVSYSQVHYELVTDPPRYVYKP